MRLFSWTAQSNTSLGPSLRIGRRVTTALLGDPDARSAAQRAGRAEEADDANGPHYTAFEIDLKPLMRARAAQSEAGVRRALAQFPGVTFAVKSFITERIEEIVSGATASSPS